ncbi:MAG TPA: hypothetical protein PKX79_12540 [Spirochaetota bacterium]|jgi:predicted RNase H-like HicB family nuclease|nr:hypothetical protein [Spirochaetota bacterium]OQA94772.1 MAG: hypothetical protein BWY23_02675 [Spirochaetes bacterium ADurb.Bin218]HOK03302.1 hypothetical protein [Spirochaetota bacterium]HOK93594.1 hypothetical protein [Spirochaetota bacterium]HON16844.1 hypothetical protein [Spirochaetota bacterium]
MLSISVNLILNGDEYIANCPELDINCYGSNKNEAIRRLKNVIQFYITSAKELGLELTEIKEINIEGCDKIYTSNLVIPKTDKIN